jgi:hypothetical protein
MLRSAYSARSAPRQDPLTFRSQAKLSLGFWVFGGYNEHMRIWDIEHRKLCRNHLLGEHRELHAIWSILTNNKKGYSRHPETLRWQGKLKALYLRHGLLVKELKRRGYRHKSNLGKRFATGSRMQNSFVNSYREQIQIIRRKKCGCKV